MQAMLYTPRLCITKIKIHTPFMHDKKFSFGDLASQITATLVVGAFFTVILSCVGCVNPKEEMHGPHNPYGHVGDFQWYKPAKEDDLVLRGMTPEPIIVSNRKREEPGFINLMIKILPRPLAKKASKRRGWCGVILPRKKRNYKKY